MEGNSQFAIYMDPISKAVGLAWDVTSYGERLSGVGFVTRQGQHTLYSWENVPTKGFVNFGQHGDFGRIEFLLSQPKLESSTPSLSGARLDTLWTLWHDKLWLIYEVTPQAGGGPYYLQGSIPYEVQPGVYWALHVTYGQSGDDYEYHVTFGEIIHGDMGYSRFQGPINQSSCAGMR